MGTGEFNAGGNPAMDWHPIQGVSQSEPKGPTWNRHNSYIVFTAIIRLGGVDGSCFKTKLGISVFIDTAPAAKPLSWQQH